MIKIRQKTENTDKSLIFSLVQKMVESQHVKEVLGFRFTQKTEDVAAVSILHTARV